MSRVRPLRHHQWMRLHAWRASLLICAGVLSGPAMGQTCSFNLSQPNIASFGTIDPALSTTMTFSLVLNYRCTGGANASFSLAGANDTGPGAFRLRNLTQPTQFMAYSVSTVNTPGTKVTIDGQLVAANYRDAYVGTYADTLNVLVLP